VTFGEHIGQNDDLAQLFVQGVLSNEIFVLAFGSVLWQVEKKMLALGLSVGLLHDLGCVTGCSEGVYRWGAEQKKADK